MVSVRERKWGNGQTAHVVDYVDADGKRRLQTFKTDGAANEFKRAILSAIQLDRVTEPTIPGKGIDLIWGCASIAKEIGLNHRQVFYMLENGSLPAKKIGNRWVIDRSILHAHFT